MEDDEDIEKFERDVPDPLHPLGEGMHKDAILVWEFHKAPLALRELSSHGGDEDGICWIPNGHGRPWWIERMWTQYGEINGIRFTDGVLYIWAHS